WQHLGRIGAAGAGRGGALGPRAAWPAAAAGGVRWRLHLGLGAVALLSRRRRRTTIERPPSCGLSPFPGHARGVPRAPAHTRSYRQTTRSASIIAVLLRSATARDPADACFCFPRSGFPVDRHARRTGGGAP